jgi:ribonucleotide monophosphatase NagD (HAD superfamily)
MEKVLTHIRSVVKKQGNFRPLLVTDIDGVLVRGNTPIVGTK